MTRDEQIAELQKMGSGKLLYLAKPGLVFIVAVLIIAGAFLGKPVFYAAAAAAGLVTLAVWLTTPHILNAARGLNKGFKQSGAVEISLHTWPDGEKEQESYQGVIFVDHQPLWQMNFVQPRGWEPEIGVHSVELAFIQGIEWPVIIILKEGLLYPGSKPRRPAGF